MMMAWCIMQFTNGLSVRHKTEVQGGGAPGVITDGQRGRTRWVFPAAGYSLAARPHFDRIYGFGCYRRL
jgi:hypothetical protein